MSRHRCVLFTETRLHSTVVFKQSIESIYVMPPQEVPKSVYPKYYIYALYLQNTILVTLKHTNILTLGHAW